MPDSVLRLEAAAMAFGQRRLWRDLNLEVQRGEFLAVIGSNGSGKSTLLKLILGLLPLTAGRIELFGQPVGGSSVRGLNRRIGYIPQNRSMDAGLPLRGRDLLHLGLDGHELGLPHLPFSRHSRQHRAKVNEVLAAIGALDYADKTVGSLSGGELQRLRVGQAVIGDPDLILADEPLSALDLNQQHVIAELLDERRRANNAAVLFVTHDVNPILGMVDRVLYLANGRFSIGTPDEVFRSEVLSELYDTQIEVVRDQGQIVVVGVHQHDHHPEQHLGSRGELVAGGVREII